MEPNNTKLPNGVAITQKDAADIVCSEEPVSALVKKYRTHQSVIRDIKECNKIKQQTPDHSFKSPFYTPIPFWKICFVIYLFTVGVNEFYKLSFEELELITGLQKDQLLGILGRYNLAKIGTHSFTRPDTTYNNIKSNYTDGE